MQKNKKILGSIDEAGVFFLPGLLFKHYRKLTAKSLYVSLSVGLNR